MDLGASHAISLNSDWSAQITPPRESLETIVGRGLSGPVSGRIGRIESLELGATSLRNVAASFPVSEHQNPRGTQSLAGNLGSEVLRRFKTTFDYAGGRLILVPNTSVNAPFRFDRSGIRLGLGNELVVEGIIAGSPASESGIRAGDILTHVNGKPVSIDEYDDVRAALRQSGPVRLVLRRDHQILAKTLILRPLI